MFRFIVNVSLIICLAVADVAVQDDKVTIGEIAGESIEISAGSGGDELSNLPSLFSKLLGFLFHFSTPIAFHFFTPMAFNFSTPTAFLARFKVPQHFDLANCRLTIDLSHLPKKTKFGAFPKGQTIFVFATLPGGATKVIVKRVIPKACLVESRKTVADFNEETRKITITFPHARTSTSSNDYNDEPEDDEPLPSEDDNEPQEGDGDGDFIEGDLMPRPVSVII